MEDSDHFPGNESDYQDEVCQKDGRDDLLSGVTALFLEAFTLVLLKFGLNDRVLGYLTCC